MGFNNTTYTDIVTSLTDTYKDMLNNNLYKWNDKKFMVVTYYHINQHLSVLENATGMTYANTGKESGLKFDRIEKFMLYGVEQLQLALENDDFGVVSSEISGNAIVLPNTIEPYPGDFFVINHIKEKYLFKVLSSSPDTLQNGSNFYSLEYKLSEVNDNRLEEENLAYTYVMEHENVGTNSNSIIRTDIHKTIEVLNKKIDELKRSYLDIFFFNRVDTLIYKHNICGMAIDHYIYDPYLIQFAINTRMFKMNGYDYIHIDHKIKTDPDFNSKYKKTIYYFLENKTKIKIDELHNFVDLSVINNKTSIFAYRLETYLRTKVDSQATQLETFDEELVNRIINNELYPEANINNIIIKFFNDYDVIMSDDDFDFINNLELYNNSSMFYMLPCIFYCIGEYIKNIK